MSLWRQTPVVSMTTHLIINLMKNKDVDLTRLYSGSMVGDLVGPVMVQSRHYSTSQL